MAKHTIKLDDFEGYKANVIFASSYGKTSNKSLVISTNVKNSSVVFNVYNDRELVCETAILERAIEAYNELP